MLSIEYAILALCEVGAVFCTFWLITKAITSGRRAYRRAVHKAALRLINDFPTKFAPQLALAAEATTVEDIMDAEVVDTGPIHIVPATGSLANVAVETPRDEVFDIAPRWGERAPIEAGLRERVELAEAKLAAEKAARIRQDRLRRRYLARVRRVDAALQAGSDVFAALHPALARAAA